MLISGRQRLSEPNQTSTPPCLAWLTTSVANKGPYASKPPPTSPLCISVRMYFWGLPTSPALTCMHPSTALLLPPHGCVFYFIFFVLFTLETRRNKGPPPITSLVWYFKPDKMFWLTSDFFFVCFNWLIKLSHEFSVEVKRHCYQGPGWTNRGLFWGRVGSDWVGHV